jgi:uncharacterized Zn finger protein (UPF0148 family)
MDLISVACNECGAPLSVPRTTNFLTCGHCGVQLSVKHTDDVSYTAALQEISDRTARIEEEVRGMRQEDRIEAIDRQWQITRESFMVTGEHGHKRLPTSTGSIVGGFLTVGFGIFWTVMAAQMSAPFAVFGVVIICVGIFNSIRGYHKAEGYRLAERRYKQRRKEAMRGR